MSTLVNLLQEDNALTELMLETHGVLTDEAIENIVGQWMEEIKSNLAAKVDGYEFKKEALLRRADWFKDQAEKFRTASRAMANMADKLKDRMKQVMIETDQPVLEGNLYSFRLQQGQSSVVIDDVNELPATYTREKVTVEVDKVMIKEAIESGIKVPGVHLEKGIILRSYLKK